MRLAVGKLTHPQSGRYLPPNQSIYHRPFSYAFKPFGSATGLCLRSRIRGGVLDIEVIPHLAAGPRRLVCFVFVSCFLSLPLFPASCIYHVNSHTFALC